jgi:hypothetical protein
MEAPARYPGECKPCLVDVSPAIRTELCKMGVPSGLPANRTELQMNRICAKVVLPVN